MRSVIVLLSALLCIGCSNDNVKVVRAADCTDTLRMRVLNLSGEILMPTRMISLFDGNLLVYQRKGDDVFTLINPFDSCRSRVIGKRGRGPDEYIEIDVQSIRPTDRGFICMDSGGRIRNVDLTEKPVAVTEQVFTFGHPQNGIILQDGYLGMNVLSMESEYVFYSKHSSHPQYISDYPGWTVNSAQPLPFVYIKNMIPHPQKDVFAAFYVCFRKFRILNSKGELLHDVDVRIPDTFPSYSSDAESQFFAYASYPDATEKYIYALCHNEQRAFLKTSIPEIHVWDWNGNLKKRFIADRHIDIFTVDENRGIIYAMDVNDTAKLYYATL